MKDYFTKKSTESFKQPTEYTFQKIAVQRGLITETKELRQFALLERGVHGENKFHNLLNEFGQSHWLCIRNMWLNDFSDFECDVILMTHHCVYVFEIKNYFGKFVYQNGQCSSRGIEISYNPVSQAHHATTHLKNITKSFPREIPIKGVLVFIGEHNDVHIKSQIDYLDILRSNEVYQYIEDIKNEEKECQERIDIQKLVSHYEMFEVKKPHVSTPYSPNEWHNVRTGTYCDRCSRPIKLTKSQYVSCACGFDEYQHRTIVRAACEFGVLTYGRNFVLNDIYTFIGKEVSINYLRKILKRYFETVPHSRILTFQNPGRPFSQISRQFTFDLPNMLRYLRD